MTLRAQLTLVRIDGCVRDTGAPSRAADAGQ
jgi:hypothetical protein